MSIDTVPASADSQVQDLQPRRRNGPINILIVDDEPKNLTVLETVLDDPDYRLVRAKSADEALLALVDDEFALVILDIRMPGMTGFELAQMIKQRKKTAKVPIIFLTAYYNEDQHVLEGYGTGAVDYLHKPINPAILRSKVAVFAELHNKNRVLLAEVIERRRAEEQLRELNETLEQRVTERTEALRERDRTLTTVNDALKKQAVALADANKELEKFSYSVSHDLRAPLRTIDAFSRILEEDHGPQMNENARRSLSIVRKAVGQAGELIDDLLELSKLGRQGMTVCLVNMTDLARETADDLRIMQEGRQIDLTIGNLPPCQGDPRFLKLVWINLLTNAFKYTKNQKESRIEVGCMPDDASPEMVIYYVKDNGVGFNMKYAHKLFGVFQRLHRQEDFEGTGVGLAVVQRIVHRHDGRVWAEGKVDGGATFFISLRKAMA